MSDKRKAIGLVVVLFVLGIGLGAVSEHMWYVHVIAAGTHRSASRELREQLRLSPDQGKQYDAIMADWRAKAHVMDAQEHGEWDPKYDQLRQQGRDSIRAILTPEQKVKFEAFLKHLDEERQRQQQQQGR